MVTLASGVIGGPAGRHLAAGRAGLLGVAQVLVVLSALAIALAIFQKGHCVMHGWSNPDQFWRACYSDIPVQHVTTSLSERALPILESTGWDVPLLSGLTMWGLALLTPVAGTGLAAQQWVFALWAVLALVLLIGTIPALVSMSARQPWQAAHLIASPVLVVLALTGTDLLGIALVVWGWWWWRRGQHVGAGVLLGSAILVRPIAGVFLAALVLVATRTGRSRSALHATSAAAITVAVLLVPFLLVHPEGAVAPLRTWWWNPPSYGAMTLIPQLVAIPLTTTAATLISLLGWALALAVGYWLTRHAARVPSVTRVTAPMLVIVALTSKAVPVQLALWLLPLLALSTVRWRDHLIWAGVEITYFVAVWLHIGYYSDTSRGLPPETFALVSLARMAAWSYLAYRIWSAPVHSRRSPVAAPTSDAALR